ncbi:hypothetical protein [Pseudoalteromonas luteoviolacea]|uniref:Fibronectin type-III domain-containing protein n=1 Tax=Pseudoalteromonas luteoviolacea NCIMB 1942 TaxID=1365253 RepID=A0A167BL91_9GAMM|nr:hypothetical protein [Pseudoalteromonas luteoviolacea]KZN46674.1 hypothetical protein N482_11610 [Pseudoalteromonas luteoviolacea NCIMB 1942]
MLARIWIVFMIALTARSAVASEFQQAYAPIVVGGITIFIPIEVKPNNVAYLSIKPDSAGTKLAWTPSDTASYYKVQYLKDGNWVSLSERHGATHFQVPANIAGPYRVLACHQYGCSAGTPTNRTLTQDLVIKALYSDNPQTDDRKRVVVGWQVDGASSVTLSRFENGVHRYSQTGLNPSQGSIASIIGGLAQFRLTAYGFDGTSVSRTLQVATKPVNPTLKLGNKGQYAQPFYHSELDIIEKTILEHNDSIYFATHDGQILRYAPKVGSAQPEWQQSWSIKLRGVVNNAPVVDGEYLLYSISMRDNTGMACKTRLIDGAQHSCTSEKNSNLIASPVVVKETPKSAGVFSAFSSFTSSQADVQAGVYVFHRNGTVEVLDPNNLKNVLRTFTLKGVINESVLTTPAVIVDQGNNNQQQFVIQDGKDVIGVNVPSSNTPARSSSMVQAVGRWFSDEPSTDVQKAQSNIQVLEVVWREKL